MKRWLDRNKAEKVIIILAVILAPLYIGFWLIWGILWLVKIIGDDVFITGSICIIITNGIITISCILASFISMIKNSR